MYVCSEHLTIYFTSFSDFTSSAHAAVGLKQYTRKGFLMVCANIQKAGLVVQNNKHVYSMWQTMFTGSSALCTVSAYAETHAILSQVPCLPLLFHKGLSSGTDLLQY